MTWPQSVTLHPRTPRVPAFNYATYLGGFGLFMLDHSLIWGVAILAAALAISFYGAYILNKARQSVWKNIDPLIDTLTPAQWSQQMAQMFRGKQWTVQGDDNPPEFVLEAVDHQGNAWTIHLLLPRQAINESLLAQIQSTNTSSYVLVISRDRVPRSIYTMANQNRIKVWSRVRVRAELAVWDFNQHTSTPRAVTKNR